MRLFLSDTFFDQIIKLPRNVQQKVNDFHRKFRADSTQASIHLEPIPEFKSKDLLTARLSDGYRAVLGKIDGTSYCLLYVDQHDDAYRWAKNKQFVWNNYTQSCQLIPMMDEVELPHFAHQDVTSEQPTALQQPTDEQLLKLGVPSEMLNVVRNIVDLDDLDRLSEVLPQDAFENLFNLLDNGDIEEIICEIESGKAETGSDALLSNNNRRRFIELTTDDGLANIIAQGMDKWQLFLHPSQRKLVEASYKGSMKVSGSAGTGKTVAALHRLKRLCQQQDIRVLFTTYTKTLKNNLDGLAKKMDIPSNRYTLNNIDAIMVDLAKQFGTLPEGYSVMDYSGDEKSKQLWREVLENEVSRFDEDFLYDEYVDVILYNDNKSVAEYLRQARAGRTKAISRKDRMGIWELKTKYEALKARKKKMDRLELFNLTSRYLNENNIHPYTHVIADEFQDFSNPELRFLRALVAEGPNDLFLVGDPFQRIYSGRKLNFGAAGINVRGLRSRKLKVNYRTTEEIKRMAVSVIKGQKYDDMDGGEENMNGYVSLMHGAKPVYKVLSGAKEELDQVFSWLELCASEGVLESEICIAAPSNNMLKDVQNMLHQKGLKYQNVKADGTSTGHTSGCRLCTFHSMKGLEFRVVILVGVNERNVPSKVSSDYPFSIKDPIEQKEYLAERRSLLYVAISRAQQCVFICGYGVPCGLLKTQE